MSGPRGGALPKLTSSEVARFKSKLARVGECLVWTGETNNHGYGRFAIYRGVKRIRPLAHRIAYKLDAGSDPIGVVLRHTCDNPPCCDPGHLIVGDQAANILDAMGRGRLNLSGLHEYRAKREALANEMLASGIRKCARCGEVKPLKEFRKSTNERGGHAYLCRPCNSEYQALWKIRRGIRIVGDAA